jgi:hypothetical protein
MATLSVTQAVKPSAKVTTRRWGPGRMGRDGPTAFQTGGMPDRLGAARPPTERPPRVRTPIAAVFRSVQRARARLRPLRRPRQQGFGRQAVAAQVHFG